MYNEHLYKVGGKRDEINGKPVVWNEDNAIVSTWGDLKLHPVNTAAYKPYL